MRFMRFPFRRSKLIPYETSSGAINLTAEEHSLLAKVLAGSASMDEGQRLYSSVIGRGLPFPLEWEIQVLRSALSELPNRDDLIKRLAEVETALSHPSYAEIVERSTWERSWVRFSGTSLIGLHDANELARVRSQCFADACTLLSSPHFATLGADRRTATILALHDTLMSAPSPDLVPIAELGIRQFRQMLREPGLTMPQAMGIFDALHSMYFSGVSDVVDLRRFDYIVPHFEEWLSKQSVPASPSSCSLSNEAPLTIAYLLHTAHFDRGNAVSPLIVLLANTHAKAPNRRVLLYLVQYVGSDFQAQIGESDFTLRVFPQGRSYERMDEIAAAMRADHVDVVITEQNRAIAAALFARRVAPLQMWLDTGFPFWNLKSLDWTFSPNITGAPDSILRRSGLYCHQPSSVIKSDISDSEIDRIRSSFPAGSFVLGVFVRLIKLNERVFDLLEKLLAIEPAFQLLIVGTGDPSHVKNFIAQSANANRIKFLNENVDLHVYGRVVDVMCDTFPFIGGHACREVGAQGTPVVSMLGTAWDTVLQEERNPDLLARDPEGYIDLVRRLFNDGDFRKRQRRVAFEVFADRADSERTIADLEAGINAAAKLLRNQA